MTSLQIRNFQSLKKIDLDLLPLTVIVGPSSSGKSALVRALKVLSSNERGADFITNGESSCSISATCDDWKITFERDVSSGSYRLYDGVNVEEREYTNLTGPIPEYI